MGTPSSTPTLPSVTLDAAGLAAILHCSIDTVVSNAHRAPGRLPPQVRTGGRRLIWLTADVMDWLEARRVDPAPAAASPRRRGRPAKAEQLARRRAAGGGR
jgi:hypothetical protein